MPIDKQKISKLYSWINSPTKGLITEVNGRLIPNEATPYVRNARFWQGYITKRPGLAQLSQTPATEQDCASMAFGYWTSDTTAVQTPVMWTRKRMYQLVAGTWSTVNNTYTTGTVEFASNVVTGSGGTLWSANVKAGDRIVINGQSGWAFSDNVTVGTVTDNTHLAITHSGTVTAGATYTIYRYMQGTTANLFDWTNIYGSLVFANGIDKVKRWTGTGGFTDVNSTDLGIYKFVRGWNGRVFCACSDTDPYNIIWSANGSVTDYTSAGSGNASLDESGDGITGLEVLKNQLIIFQNSNIWVGQATGIAASPNYFTPRVQGIGCIAPYSIQVVQDSVFFIGTDNIYSWDLNSDPVPIGDAIRSEFFNTVLQSNYGKIRATWWPEYKEYWLGIPWSSATECNTVLVYNVSDKSWTRHEFKGNSGNVQSFYGLGSFRADTSATIDSFTGLIDSYIQPIDQYTSGVGKKYIGLGHGTTGNTYSLDINATTDNYYSGTTAGPVEFTWSSKDMGDGVVQMVTTRVIMGYSNCSDPTTTATCSVSTQQSTTASASRTVTLFNNSGNIKNAYFDFNLSARNMRFFISHNGSANFKIHYFKVELVPCEDEVWPGTSTVTHD